MNRAKTANRLDVGLALTLQVIAWLMALTAPDELRGPWDLLSHGARSWTVVVLPAASLATILGIPLGIVSTLITRTHARLITWLLEILGGFPSIILVALLRSLTIQSDYALPISIIALMAVRIPETVCYVRTQSLRFRSSESYLATYALGAGPARLLFNHLLPSNAPALISMTFINVGVLTGIESAMAFVGLDATQSSWGTQIGHAIAQGHIRETLTPMIALMATLFATYRLAETARRRMSPNTMRPTDG